MDVVTGAYSFTGRYVATQLLESGREVRTLTRRAQDESPFGEQVRASPLTFSDPGALAEGLRGADTLYNTYWIRHPHGTATFDRAVENTRVLFEAARRANVRRVVQLSVANAAADSPFGYFRAKAAVEAALASSGLSFATVRPTLVFGRGEVLVNNIAWLLRRLPLFVVPGSGLYRIQPVAAEDLAELCVELGGRDGDVTLDAAGPDALSFDDLVHLVRAAVGSRAAVVHARPGPTLVLSRILGRHAGGTVLTADELGALSASLLTSTQQPLGKRRFADWLATAAASLGSQFASDRRRPWA